MKLFNVYFFTKSNKGYTSHQTYVCVKGRKGSYRLATTFGGDKYETVYKFTAESPRDAVLKYLKRLTDETNATLASPAIYEITLK